MIQKNPNIENKKGKKNLLKSINNENLFSSRNVILRLRKKKKTKRQEVKEGYVSRKCKLINKNCINEEEKKS